MPFKRFPYSPLVFSAAVLAMTFLSNPAQGQMAVQDPAKPQTPPKAPATDPDKDAEAAKAWSAIFHAQIAMDDAKADERNPAGLKFKFAKIDEATQSEGHSQRYRAYVAGAPENKTYKLGVWKIGEDPEPLEMAVYVNAKGLLMLHKPKPEQENQDSVAAEDEIDLSVEAAKGEPIRYVLASEDSAVMIPGTLVPFPIENTDGGCRLEARLAMPDAEAILLYADGLPAGTEVPFQSKSEGQTEQGTFTVNAKGHAASVGLPYVEDKDSGTVKVAIATKECSVSVEVPWGHGTYQPM